MVSKDRIVFEVDKARCPVCNGKLEILGSLFVRTDVYMWGCTKCHTVYYVRYTERER